MWWKILILQIFILNLNPNTEKFPVRLEFSGNFWFSSSFWSVFGLFGQMFDVKSTKNLIFSNFLENPWSYTFGKLLYFCKNKGFLKFYAVVSISQKILLSQQVFIAGFYNIVYVFHNSEKQYHRFILNSTIKIKPSYSNRISTLTMNSAFIFWLFVCLVITLLNHFFNENVDFFKIAVSPDNNI